MHGAHVNTPRKGTGHKKQIKIIPQRKLIHCAYKTWDQTYLHTSNHVGESSSRYTGDQKLAGKTATGGAIE